MLEYTRMNKGNNMDIMPYRLTEEMYRAIENRFKEPREREIVVFCLEKSLEKQSEVVIDTVNRKIDQIIYEVKLELSKTFATKTDLEIVSAVLEKKISDLEIKITKDMANLELRVTKEINNVRTELKEDIANVRTEIAEVRTELKEDIANVRTELKEDISNIKTDIASLATSVESLKKGFDDKINSFKYSVIAWIAGSLIVGLGLVATINKLL